MTAENRKRTGAYFTPEPAAAALVRWAVRSRGDRLLDPSCGDGRFLALHRNSYGVEQERSSAAQASMRAPHAEIHTGEFFRWVSSTAERFECAAGNPPFIRYQSFSGDTRRRALDYCRGLGVAFSGLASSWAPFLVAAASVLRPGGRIAFVVPAEIGHAPYARPVVDYLLDHFGYVQVVAVKSKIFEDLSEDVWLLFADRYGDESDHIHLTTAEQFTYSAEPPKATVCVRAEEWRGWGGRLRPFLLGAKARERYQGVSTDAAVRRLGDVARIGIGYVTGANDFFHLRPSQVRALGIDGCFLRVAVRNGRVLPRRELTRETVRGWLARDEAVLLLSLSGAEELPTAVLRYLDSENGKAARMGYKCRTREPWYAVPDVHVPQAFLTYMSSVTPNLVVNRARCVGTNSVHTVRLRNGMSADALVNLWSSPVRELSCELEGHPLGGGMLKLEPREASRILVGQPNAPSSADLRLFKESVEVLRSWRHGGNGKQDV